MRKIYFCQEDIHENWLVHVCKFKCNFSNQLEIHLCHRLSMCEVSHKVNQCTNMGGVLISLEVGL